MSVAAASIALPMAPESAEPPEPFFNDAIAASSAATRLARPLSAAGFAATAFLAGAGFFALALAFVFGFAAAFFFAPLAFAMRSLPMREPLADRRPTRARRKPARGRFRRVVAR